LPKRKREVQEVFGKSQRQRATHPKEGERDGKLWRGGTMPRENNISKNKRGEPKVKKKGNAKKTSFSGK